MKNKRRINESHWLTRVYCLKSPVALAGSDRTVIMLLECASES